MPQGRSSRPRARQKAKREADEKAKREAEEKAKREAEERRSAQLRRSWGARPGRGGADHGEAGASAQLLRRRSERPRKRRSARPRRRQSRAAYEEAGRGRGEGELYQSSPAASLRTVHYALSTKLMQLCHVCTSSHPPRPPAHTAAARAPPSGGRGGRARAHGNMQAHHAYMYCIRAQRVIKLQVMYQAPGLATVLKNKYIPSCMVHRRRCPKEQIYPIMHGTSPAHPQENTNRLPQRLVRCKYVSLHVRLRVCLSPLTFYLSL